MILIAAVALTALAISVAGGRLRLLAGLRFQGLWALWSALGMQIVIVSVMPDRFPAVHVPVHLLSYVLLAVFFIANARLPGLRLMAAGWLCNFAAIAANGGVMPASPRALRTAGIDATNGFANSAAVVDPSLAWLGDVFAVPASIPLANVFSVGDVLLVVGAAVTMLVACRPGPAEVGRDESATAGARCRS